MHCVCAVCVLQCVCVNEQQYGPSGEEPYGGVGPRSEQPRLSRVELTVQYTYLVHNLVSSQHLHWHNKWILQQVTVYHPIAVSYTHLTLPTIYSV